MALIRVPGAGSTFHSVDSFEVNNETGSMRQFKVGITVEVIDHDYDLALIIPKQDNKVIGTLRLDLFGA